jgi:UDPglucose 6-dehydrogenase
MKISVYGCELSGLVTAAALASTGNEVLGIPVGTAKPNNLQKGELPREEPGLAEMVKTQVAEGRLNFTESWEAGVEHGDIFFLSMPSWRAHRAQEVIDLLGEKINKAVTVVIQTTLPVGSADQFEARLKLAFANRGLVEKVSVVAMPEFISEGSAVQNFTRPDRIVLGSQDEEAIELMKDLMRPFNRMTDQIKVMSTRAAEYTKYAVNALLATRISLVNELANNAEMYNVDIEEVRQGIGSDHRIGFNYLYPGCGFGGPSFASDVRSLVEALSARGSDVDLLETVLEINESQKEVMFRKAWRYFNADLRGLTFAVWGLSFKPNTATVENAPSLKTIEALIAQGASVKAYDPKANDSFQKVWGDRGGIALFDNMYEALDGVDALVVLTEWKHFWNPDYVQMLKRMKGNVIFDGRNIYEPERMATHGFTYFGVGRGEKI